MKESTGDLATRHETGWPWKVPKSRKEEPQNICQ